jgi:hypothetical protein
MADDPSRVVSGQAAAGALGSLSKVQSVDQWMHLGVSVSAFANCGRAVAHVRGS